jgi:hypothetical protein
MISLIYKIYGDINPIRKALTVDAPAAAAKGGSEAGKLMGAQFKSAILRYVGAGAVLGLVTQLASKAAETLKGAQKAGLDVEAYQELQKAVEQTGLSMEELLEKAKLVPKEFEEMMRSIRAQGGIISKGDVENLNEVNDMMTSIKSGALAFFASIWQGLKFMRFGMSMGTAGNVKDADLFGQLPAAGAGPLSPAAAFNDALKRRQAGAENMASDLGAAAGFVAMGLGIGRETAERAGLVSKAGSAKTIDDVVKAIQDVDKTLKKEL